jgi:hypothetical protein
MARRPPDPPWRIGLQVVTPNGPGVIVGITSDRTVAAVVLDGVELGRDRAHHETFPLARCTALYGV